MRHMYVDWSEGYGSEHMYEDLSKYFKEHEEEKGKKKITLYKNKEE